MKVSAAELQSYIDRAATILRCAPEFTARRMAALSIGMDCARCSGAGHYSRNAQGSTRCYDCKGAGLVLPSTDKAWTLALVQCAESAEDGRLARYESYLQASHAAKRARAKMDAARAESGIYAWTFLSGATGDDMARRLAILKHCDSVKESAENALHKLRDLGGAPLVDATIAAMVMVDAAILTYHEATL